MRERAKRLPYPLRPAHRHPRAVRATYLLLLGVELVGACLLDARQRQIAEALTEPHPRQLAAARELVGVRVALAAHDGDRDDRMR